MSRKVMRQVFEPLMRAAVDGDKKVSHSKLAEEVEAAVALSLSMRQSAHRRTKARLAALATAARPPSCSIATPADGPMSPASAKAACSAPTRVPLRLGGT